MSSALEVLIVKTAMPFWQHATGALYHTPYSAAGMPPEQGSHITTQKNLQAARAADTEWRRGNAGSSLYADPPAGYRLVPQDAVRKLQLPS